MFIAIITIGLVVIICLLAIFGVLDKILDKVTDKEGEQ